jgi:hypothetical protein
LTKTFEFMDEITPDAGRAAIQDLHRGAQAAGMIKRAQVRALGRFLMDDRSISRDEADALFALDASSCAKCPEWTEFLVDAVTDHVVWQARPTGVLNSEQAEWLLAKADGSKSISALAVLVNILAEADRVPAWFIAAVRGRVALGWPGVEEALAAANLVRAA